MGKNAPKKRTYPPPISEPPLFSDCLKCVLLLAAMGLDGFGRVMVDFSVQGMSNSEAQCNFQAFKRRTSGFCRKDLELRPVLPKTVRPFFGRTIHHHCRHLLVSPSCSSPCLDLKFRSAVQFPCVQVWSQRVWSKGPRVTAVFVWGCSSPLSISACPNFVT